MKLVEYTDRRCFRYLRCTPCPPGCYRPCPSAWVVAVQTPEETYKPALVYWVDLASYWGDGLSWLYLKTFYPRSVLVDRTFRPLRKLGKVDSDQKVCYWMRHAREHKKWISRSSQFEIPVAATWYDRWFGQSTFGYDVLLRSEHRVHRYERFESCRYLRQAIVSPKHPNSISRRHFFDHREVVAWIEVDPVIQSLHCAENWNRVFFVDHSTKHGTGNYVDGLHSPPDHAGLVEHWSISPGFEPKPFLGEPRAFDSGDISRHKAARQEYLESVGIT